MCFLQTVHFKSQHPLLFRCSKSGQLVSLFELHRHILDASLILEWAVGWVFCSRKTNTRKIAQNLWQVIPILVCFQSFTHFNKMFSQLKPVSCLPVLPGITPLLVCNFCCFSLVKTKAKSCGIMGVVARPESNRNVHRQDNVLTSQDSMKNVHKKCMEAFWNTEVYFYLQNFLKDWITHTQPTAVPLSSSVPFGISERMIQKVNL